MSEDITLKIFTPERTFMNKKVHRVVLPYGHVNLTIIKDRAPTSLVLKAGKLDILNDNNDVEASYFIDGGVVDVAKDVCTISVRHIVKTTAITAEQAKQKQQEEPQNAEFYAMIAEFLLVTAINLMSES